MPTSYQAPMRRDKEKKTTFSQTKSTNLADAQGRVEVLLQGKTGDVYAIRPAQTLAEAVEILRDRGIGALVVTDVDGSLKGILSERDIVRKLADTPGQTLPRRVEEVMTAKVQTCAPSDTLVSVLQRMTEGKFRHMPVSDEGKLLGMITIGDVVIHRLRELEHEALQLKQMIVG